MSYDPNYKRKRPGKRHPLASVWHHMWRRCEDPNVKHYNRYGGRGITVDPAWESFEQFCSDMGPRPAGFTLERKDNSLGYSKRNCEWASVHTQCRNRKSNKFITHDGRTQCATDWAIELGLRPRVVLSRLRAGHTDPRVLFASVPNKKSMSSSLKSR